MEKIDSFEGFLKKKKEEEQENKINWEERKNKWLISINQLYDNIKTWLKPFEEQGLVIIKTEKTININEEYIGQYSTNRLDIYLGNDIVSLTPKGTLIIGSNGRIDMNGSKGEVMLIEQEWDDWKFAKRTPKLETWDVTEDSLKDILQDLV